MENKNALFGKITDDTERQKALKEKEARLEKMYLILITYTRESDDGDDDTVMVYEFHQGRDAVITALVNYVKNYNIEWDESLILVEGKDITKGVPITQFLKRFSKTVYSEEDFDLSDYYTDTTEAVEESKPKTEDEEIAATIFNALNGGNK